MEAKRADNIASTVVISDRFGERRAQNAHQAETAETALEPGVKLGRYLIVNRLGGGGMGVVYKAHDTELNRTVALKILPPRLCKSPEYLSRFRAEAQAQARLNNPFVVTLYSMMEMPAGAVLVLEYVEGETLEQRIKRRGPLPLPEALRIFDLALQGVSHIHQMGVVHRDLKPSNIFLAKDEQVKIMDFGVAKLMDGHDMHQTAAMVGTLLYISPEQINGRDTDFRTDIYTLGISLFEAVTGRLPFERRTDYALMHAHVQETPPRPQTFLRQIQPALEWVILKAIEKEPERRFRSTDEFRAALIGQGLVERRRGRGATQSAPAKHSLPDMTLLHQELMRYRLTPPNRLLGGLALDVALVAGVVMLVATLGLYPVRHAPMQEVAGVAGKTEMHAGAKTTTDNNKQLARKARHRPAPVAAAPAAAKKSSYESVMQSLGG